MAKKDTNGKAYVITGPTSGIGYATALELAKHGTVILVGRNQDKLTKVKDEIGFTGGHALAVQCDISDITSVRQAAKHIVDLGIPVAGVLNNAGVMQQKVRKSAQGWDMTFATNHLGAFAFTEALADYLPDGANILFVASAIEDPARKPAKIMGMKGGRYISAEASAQGRWLAGGAKIAGADAYATSKQCILAAALFFAKETPRLHFNAIEPGITPETNLGSEDSNAIMRFVFRRMISIIPAFSRYKSTPGKTAKIITDVLSSRSGKTGVYFDEKGQPMAASTLARDPQFQERVVAETRALLSTVKA